MLNTDTVVVQVRRLTDAFGWRPHFPHESDTFGVVGSDHMRKFNARLLQPNVGRQQVCTAIWVRDFC